MVVIKKYAEELKRRWLSKSSCYLWGYENTNRTKLSRLSAYQFKEKRYQKLRSAELSM